MDSALMVEGAPLSSKNMTAAGILCFFLGGLGAHRLYVGKLVTGGFQLATWSGGMILVIIGLSEEALIALAALGFLMLIAGSIWIIVDFITIIAGKFLDIKGMALRSVPITKPAPALARTSGFTSSRFGLFVFGAPLAMAVLVIMFAIIAGSVNEAENTRQSKTQAEQQLSERQAPVRSTQATRTTSARSSTTTRDTGVQTGHSPTCGPISGQSRDDLNNLSEFCRLGVAGGVESASAAESLLWLKVNEEMAIVMTANRLQTEQLMRSWMRGWRAVTDRTAVTVTIEWGNVEVAKGRTTLSGGDRVTIRQ